MVWYGVVVSLLAAALCTACAATPSIIPNSSGVTLEKLFQLAAARDTQGLLQLERAIGVSPDPAIGVGFPLALYIADPERFAQRFLESFPTTYGELMYGLYEVEKAGVEPEPDFAVGTLGQFARAGNATATRKLLLAYAHSDGAMAEGLFEELVKLLLTRPKDVLPAFGLLIPQERERVLQAIRVLLAGDAGQEIARSLRSFRDLSDRDRKSADILIRALEGAP